MDPSKDYYAVFGVLPSIEAPAIRAVYLALLKEYHPDVCNRRNDEAIMRTKEINEAYSILGDEKLRRKYDWLHADLRSKSGVYKNQHNEKITKKVNINRYWQSYGEPRAGPCQNRAKAKNYRDPGTSKLQGTDRLRVFVVGIVVSVALGFIIAVFAGSV